MDKTSCPGQPGALEGSTVSGMSFTQFGGSRHLGLRRPPKSKLVPDWSFQADPFRERRDLNLAQCTGSVYRVSKKAN